MRVETLERQRDLLTEEIGRLEQEGEAVYRPDFWLDSFTAGNGKRYYRRRWIGFDGKKTGEYISKEEFDYLIEVHRRGRKIARLKRQRDQVVSDIARLTRITERYGLPSA